MRNSILGRIPSFLLLCGILLAISGCGEKVQPVPVIVDTKPPIALTMHVTPPVWAGDSNLDLMNYTIGMEKALNECNQKLSKLQ